MKTKAIRLIALVLCAVIAVSVLASCGGGAEGSYSYTREGTTMTITLKSGGKGYVEYKYSSGTSEKEDITWSQDGDKISAQMEGEEVVEIFTLSDDGLKSESLGVVFTKD